MPPLPLQRHFRHVDRRDLYIDLEARVQYLHTFLDFSTRDIEALIGGSKYIKSLIPAVVNIVYHKLLQYDITAQAFVTRSTSFTPPPVTLTPTSSSPDPSATPPDISALSESCPTILHRKKFMRAYLTKICSDPSQMSFWSYLNKVGMMHVGLGRQHPLHVEYVHIGMCLGLIQDILSEAILSHPKLHLSRKIAIVKALGKVIWIQNDLFAKWYVRDGDEFKGKNGLGEEGEEGEVEVKIEEEGYVNGKKVLNVDEVNSGGESGGEGMTATKGNGEDACPFAAMAAVVEGLKVDNPHLSKPAAEPEKV